MMSDILCPMSVVCCLMSDVLMSDIFCIMYDVRRLMCYISGVQYLVSDL